MLVKLEKVQTLFRSPIPQVSDLSPAYFPAYSECSGGLFGDNSGVIFNSP